MEDWRDGFRKIVRVLSVPEGILFFLELYSWEAVIFCYVAPLFLSVPIMLIIFAFQFDFIISIVLIFTALITMIPWLLIPYWIVRVKSGRWRMTAFWGLCNVFVAAFWLLLLTW